MKIKGDYKVLLFSNEIHTLLSWKICRPRMAIFYPTYSCQLNCRDCLYGSELDNIHFPVDKIDYLLDELVLNWVKAIELSWWGEPLNYIGIKKLLNKCLNRGLEVGIITNWVNINSNIYDELCKTEYVRISLPSLLNKNYAKITWSNEKILYNVLTNIEKLINYRNRIWSTTKIWLKMTIWLDNFKEIELLLQKSIKLWVNYCQVKLLRNSIKELKEDNVRELKGMLLYLKNKYKVSEDFFIFELDKSVLKSRCWLNPLHTVIDPKWDVYLCCYFQYRKEEMKIWNILNNKFSKIWGSKKHLEKYNNTNITLCNRYDCRFHGYNNFANKVFKNKELDINFI